MIYIKNKKEFIAKMWNIHGQHINGEKKKETNPNND